MSGSIHILFFYDYFGIFRWLCFPHLLFLYFLFRTLEKPFVSFNFIFLFITLTLCTYIISFVSFLNSYENVNLFIRKFVVVLYFISPLIVCLKLSINKTRTFLRIAFITNLFLYFLSFTSKFPFYYIITKSFQSTPFLSRAYFQESSHFASYTIILLLLLQLFENNLNYKRISLLITICLVFISGSKLGFIVLSLFILLSINFKNYLFTLSVLSLLIYFLLPIFYFDLYSFYSTNTRIFLILSYIYTFIQNPLGIGFYNQQDYLHILSSVLFYMPSNEYLEMLKTGINLSSKSVWFDMFSYFGLFYFIFIFYVLRKIYIVPKIHNFIIPFIILGFGVSGVFCFIYNFILVFITYNISNLYYYNLAKR